MKKVFGLLQVSVFSAWLVSCADVDSRNNPTDPMADNYEAVIPNENAESSSSVKPQSSSSDDISSSSSESLSSAEEESSGSVEPESSSSSVISSGSEESSSSFDSSGSVEPEGSSSIVSSSSVESSSSIVSSSSVAEFICGESKMVRGSIEYNTVEILNTCWTAENMKNELSSVETFTCYDNDPANCEKYGMMYSYEAASSLCPTGWRLPEVTDLQNMLDYSGEWSELAGMYLKSKDGWVGDAEPGNDLLGFNALPGGVYSNKFSGLNSVGVWWTSSKKTVTSHYVLKLTGDEDAFYADGNALENEYYASVRCIKK